ncbi:hypothetical protein HMI55_006999 [Coelomomyces lativittatus]|nr:hypothetical protein HMI55_006999 [Coelomomyces lativittatus]
MVLPGVLQSPKLMILKISSSFSFRPTNHLSVEPHLNSYLQQSQNICYLLNHLPNLKILDISRPIFWRRSIPKGSDIPIHCLRELTIRETSAWSLVNLTGFLKRAQAPFLRVFHLEVDLHLPRDFFYSLASGCTQLETLKLCHTKLAPEHLVDIAQCGLARSLKEISFHYVESFFPHQGYPVYKSLLLYLANSFPLLERLELVHSDWLDVDTLEWSPVHSPHGLKELVLFDLGEHYLGDIGFIASLFPTLISLKLHLDYRDFSDMSPLLGLTSLNHVELRCREVTHRSSSPSNSVVPLELEFSTTQLTSLIFWVPPARSVLLHQCLFPCCTTLTSLVLNYPNTSFCDLLCSQDLNFRQLRHLEIRALGSEGHKNGQRLLQFLGRCAPKLRQVHLECLHYLVQPLEASILDSLSTTHLNALHVQGFAITTEVLEVLYRWREGLKTLTFCGPAFDVMDVEMHTALCGLLQHTRLLNQLVLSVSDIELPSLGSIHPVVIGSTGFLLKERESAHKRRVYQCHLAKMYPWIEEISVWSKLASRDISRII